MKIINPRDDAKIPVVAHKPEIAGPLNAVAQSIKMYANEHKIYPTREQGLPNFLRFQFGAKIYLMAIELKGSHFSNRELDIIKEFKRMGVMVLVVKSLHTGIGILDGLRIDYAKRQPTIEPVAKPKTLAKPTTEPDAQPKTMWLIRKLRGQ